MTAEDIRELRAKLKLGREKFAALIGASGTAVWNWEKEGKTPLPVFMARMEKLKRNTK